MSNSVTNYTGSPTNGRMDKRINRLLRVTGVVDEPVKGDGVEKDEWNENDVELQQVADDHEEHADEPISREPAGVECLIGIPHHKTGEQKQKDKNNGGNSMYRMRIGAGNGTLQVQDQKRKMDEHEHENKGYF